MRHSARHALLAVLVAIIAFPSHAGIITFNSRGAFDAAAPGLPIEDFETLTGSVSAGGSDIFAPPVDSSTNQTPIAPGDILPGIGFSLTAGPGSLVLLNPSFGAGVPSNILGPNTFVDELQIDLNPTVIAIGMDVFGFAAQPGSVQMTFFNGATNLGMLVVDADTVANFGGAIATGTDVISRVSLLMQVDNIGGSALGELVDNVAFGNPASVPEPTTILLLGLGLAGLGFARKRLH